MDAPRVVIEVDGVDVRWDDLISSEFENTLYLAADSMSATFNNGMLLSEWFKKSQKVKLYMGYVKDPQKWSKSDLTHLFTGKIDGVIPSFAGDMRVKIICRDYSAPLIDNEYSVAFAKRTSSQVAALLAQKQGLKPVVADTTVTVDQDIYADKKEWEVLQALADLEGFVCFVTKDMELYFGPRKDADESVAAQFFYRQPGRANCRIDFDDSEVGVINKVTVRHWLGKNKRLVEAFAVNDSLLKAMGGKVKERIIYESKAKNVALAKQIAEKRLGELSRSVVTGSGSAIGNPGIVTEKRVQVDGCGRFSGLYYVEKAVHSFSKSGGYTTAFDITSIRPDGAEQYRQDLYD